MDNPYTVFCNLIQYVLYCEPTNELPEGTIIENIKEKFNITLPHSIIRTSIKILQKEGIVESKKLYKLICCKLDIDRFERDMDTLKQAAQKLIQAIKCFIIEKYEQEWSDERISNALSNLLKVYDYDNALSIFSSDSIKVTPDKISDEYYIQKYIQILLGNKDSSGYEHLLQIIKGILIIIGISQSDGEYSKKKYKGTKFFLDTKLVLRYLGFSNDANIQAIEELVTLIKDYYGGKICVFEKTVDEVQGALMRASGEVKQYGAPQDSELQMFYFQKKYDEDDFKIASDSVKVYLRQKDILIEERPHWNGYFEQKYSIGTEALSNYIVKVTGWKKTSVDNDVDNINQLNIMRRGNYSLRYGGEHRLPVLVTSNYALIKVIKDFIKENNANDDSDYKYLNKVPIISDDNLACGIWSSSAFLTDLPVIKLSQIAYSAQQTDSALFYKIRDKASKLEEKHSKGIILLDETRSEKLNEIIVKKTEGEYDLITEEIIANSFDEYMSIMTVDKTKTIMELKESLMEQKDKNENYFEDLVSIAASKYKNKFGFIGRSIYLLVKYWWIAIDILLCIITVLLNHFLNQEWLFVSSIIVSIILGVAAIVINYAKQGKCVKSAYHKINCFLQKYYSERIKSLLKDNEKQYEMEIIKVCMSESRFLPEENNKN